MASLPKVTLDPLAAYPPAAAARTALLARDWPTFKARYAELDWAGRTLVANNQDPPRRYSMPWLTVFGDSQHASVALRRLVRVEAQLRTGDVNDPAIATVLGGALIVHAWRIRSTSRAHNVSARRFELFHHHLRRADQVLADVTGPDPGQVAAWALRLATARGLELGERETTRRYAEVAQRDPANVVAQRHMVQQLAPKWGGSFGKMHGFARACLLAAPDGSLAGSAVADAHIEHVFTLPASGRTGYLRQPEVLAELHEAAGRSIFHPAYRPVTGWVNATNTFALAFCQAQEYPAAARCFEALGGFATDRPWDYAGNPVDLFRGQRRLARFKARRASAKASA